MNPVWTCEWSLKASKAQLLTTNACILEESRRSEAPFLVMLRVNSGMRDRLATNKEERMLFLGHLVDLPSICCSRQLALSKSPLSTCPALRCILTALQRCHRTRSCDIVLPCFEQNVGSSRLLRGVLGVRYPLSVRVEAGSTKFLAGCAYLSPKEAFVAIVNRDISPPPAGVGMWPCRRCSGADCKRLFCFKQAFTAQEYGWYCPQRLCGWRESREVEEWVEGECKEIMEDLEIA